MEEYRVGDRLLLGEEFCSIRYIGGIDAWPNETAFGVEWDNSERGRHSGTFNGHTYFHTHKLGAGSFLKWSKVQKAIRCSFFEALKESYGSVQDNTQTTQISSKVIEFVGFSELDKRNNNLDLLETLSLKQKNIAYTWRLDEPSTDISPVFTQLKSLDISYNLITSFQNVVNLLDMMPRLSSITVDGNALHFPVDAGTVPKRYTNITRISLVRCQLTVQTLALILEYFPHLEALDVSENCLSEECLKTLQLPETLKSLSLRGLSLRQIPSTLLTSHVKDIDLSHNCITTTLNTGIMQNTSIEITSLDISHNSITTWETLDSINDAFRNLVSLRINYSMIRDTGCSDQFSGDDDDDDDNALFYTTIARFSGLRILNGSILTTELKKEAELYLVSEIKKGNATMNISCERWAYFKETYNIDEGVGKQDNNDAMTELTAALDVLVIIVHHLESNASTQIYVQPQQTIRYLKGLVGKQLGLDVLPMRLSYSPSGSRESIERIKRDFSPISDLALENGCTIYVA